MEDKSEERVSKRDCIRKEDQESRVLRYGWQAGVESGSKKFVRPAREDGAVGPYPVHLKYEDEG